MTVAATIEQRVRDGLAVAHLEIENESHMHSVGAGAQTHFRLVIISNDFSGLLPVRRHQQVYAALGDVFERGLHALALHTFTVDEWQVRAGQADASPNCRGGAGK